VSNIKARDRDAVLQALRAGVVPRVGQHLVQVGRSRELEALIGDIGRVAEGASAFRLVIGEYGSGKTFFLNLVRAVGLEKKLVVANADLNPDRRLHATGGQARSLYAELMRNLATRTKPEGGALSGVVEKFVSGVVSDAKSRGVKPDAVIHERLGHLSEMVGGYDFASVVEAYWRGFESADEVLKGNAVRWLRGEFATKTDARAALGVRTIVDDASVYDQLKLLARFVRLAGYAGLFICLDEMVNLYKMTNTQARNANYEQILRILNDVLQNPPEGLGFVLGGTPEFLMDTRRGLYSYAALQSRLAENTFAREGRVDYSSPVIKLGALSQEDFFVLLQKLRHVYASGDTKKYLVPDEALTGFMEQAHQRLGEAYFRTPRTTITAFISLLAVLEQNRGSTWQALLGKIEMARDEEPTMADVNEDSAVGASSRAGAQREDDELATFKL
jgi:hypothetical protein